MDETQEIIKEFLIESNENLAQLDQEFVELEQRPTDQTLLSSIFRTIRRWPDESPSDTQPKPRQQERTRIDLLS